jgi:hypothetical protein
VVALPENAPRYPTHTGGHVESWFVRANHPTEPKAIWLKITVLRKEDGTAVADAWCTLFDGDRTFGAKQTVPLAEARMDGSEFTVGSCRMAPESGAEGRLSRGQSVASWKLRWFAVPVLGEPLCLFPNQWLIDGPFPKMKTLTPAPAIRVDGEITWDGQRWDVRGWLGSQGHNWGREHTREYAWGQVVFADGAGEPLATVEGFSGRAKIGPVVTPLFSAMVVRRGTRVYRFDRMFARWTQKPSIEGHAGSKGRTTGPLHWNLKLRGHEGDAELDMVAAPERVACLGYRNPDDSLAYCLNSKLARVSLRVNPRNEDGFVLATEHGGALEFLTRTPDPRFPEPV